MKNNPVFKSYLSSPIMRFFSRPKPGSRPAKPFGKAFRPKVGLGWRAPLRWIRDLILLFLLSSLLAVLFFRFVPPPMTPLMAIRAIGYALDGSTPILDKDWGPMDRISPRLAEAVVASEDQRFFDHHGFDWGAIQSVISANDRGKRKRGASTISQQTAKNLFLWPDRSWARKGLEVYFTFLIELLWSKERILEVYLNIIETGNGTYGAEAAAQRYFHVTAGRLTSSQAALIAASLPNPRRWSPSQPTGYLQRRQSWILRQMDQLGPLPDDLSEGGPRSVPGAPPAIRTRKSSLPVEDLGPQEDSVDQPFPAGRELQSGDTGTLNRLPPETQTPPPSSGESDLPAPRSDRGTDEAADQGSYPYPDALPPAGHGRSAPPPDSLLPAP
ncbi:MAG: monofunctional biosynthetic peptidoglycan transglycosylase [Fibrobacteria bacterium]